MVEDWRPGATLAKIKQRARLLKTIRAFMEERGILEVETPVFSRAGNTDPSLESFTTTFHSPQAGAPELFYLHTSPEFAMKRLLAAGTGSIYQIARVFRNEECGRQHQPEFTLLEWYRTDFDHHQLMDEIADLLKALNFGQSRRVAFGELFQERTGIDPHDCDVSTLYKAAADQGLVNPDRDRKILLEFLFDRLIGSGLGHDAPLFVYDYPVCQAALARIRRDPPPVAERFELFMNGMEIANGYNELRDAIEQKARFEVDNEMRRKMGLAEIPVDARLLAALEQGLPSCAGAAVGLDRLLMVLSGSDSIEDVVTFPANRA